MISQYGKTDRSDLGPRNFAEFLFKRLTLKGFDPAPEALNQLFRGDNTGKLFVEYDDPPMG